MRRFYDGREILQNAPAALDCFQDTLCNANGAPDRRSNTLKQSHVVKHCCMNRKRQDIENVKHLYPSICVLQIAYLQVSTTWIFPMSSAGSDLSHAFPVCSTDGCDTCQYSRCVWTDGQRFQQCCHVDRAHQSPQMVCNRSHEGKTRFTLH